MYKIKFDLAQISVYRGELMGVAAIAIILCHAPANIPQIPLVLGRVLSALGMFGNPTFFSFQELDYIILLK